MRVPERGTRIPYAVWPKSPTDMNANNDCVCPLCNSYGCYLGLCHCWPNTTYDISLSIRISDDMTKEYMLCIDNITQELNGTYVQFFYDRFINIACVSNNTRTFPQVYRLYVSSYWISVGNFINI